MATRKGQQLPEDTEQKKINLAKMVKETIDTLKITDYHFWVNADQTPVQFESIPKRTIEAVGSKTVTIIYLMIGLGEVNRGRQATHHVYGGRSRRWDKAYVVDCTQGPQFKDSCNGKRKSIVEEWMGKRTLE